jgi:hypothetical protein
VPCDDVGVTRVLVVTRFVETLGYPLMKPLKLHRLDTDEQGVKHAAMDELKVVDGTSVDELGMRRLEDRRPDLFTAPVRADDVSKIEPEPEHRGDPQYHARRRREPLDALQDELEDIRGDLNGVETRLVSDPAPP